MLGGSLTPVLSSVEPIQDSPVRRFSTPRLAPITLALLLSTGCAMPAPDPKPQAAVDTRDIQLNLPEPAAVPAACDCEPAVAVEENDFDRGIRALVARDYTQARVYFGRHRDSGDTGASREADVGLAFVALLDESADALPATAPGADERAEMMSLAMALVESLEGRVDALNAVNAMLEENLAKREEALKRLRDLTLGQEEGSP